MKLELQRYAVMKTEKSCIKFNNGNLYSLQGYNIAQSHYILYRAINVFSNLTLKFRTIAIFKSSSQKYYVNTFCRLCPWSFTLPNSICLSVVFHELSP
jgi:hypothetical protein